MQFIEIEAREESEGRGKHVVAEKMSWKIYVKWSSAYRQTLR